MEEVFLVCTMFDQKYMFWSTEWPGSGTGCYVACTISTIFEFVLVNRVAAIGITVVLLASRLDLELVFWSTKQRTISRVVVAEP